MKRRDDEHRFLAAELFAGVGGFRLGLEATDRWRVVWSNQWEPPGTDAKQFASRCYVSHFGAEGHINEDFARVLDWVETRKAGIRLPRVDLAVGGFPCQDYSVARPLNQAQGIVGKKGILWWEIHRYLTLLGERRRPRFVLLENVDRLLNSPGNQRGRDFAIILSSLAALKYDVEWRVINAADYGEPQRRRRIFILAIRRGFLRESGAMRLTSGLLAKALPCRLDDSLQIGVSVADLFIEPEVHNVSARFGRGLVRSPFRNAGFMRRGEVWTRTVRALYDGKRATLGEILQPDDTIAENYVLRADQLRQWRYLKEAKSEPRTHKASGAAYNYAEGALPFPDPLDRPSRTILTGEGGSGPSRFKHVVAMGNGELRRLVPEELERLNGFPAGWTRGFMTDGQRAFCMGNALVVGIVRRIADVLARELSVRTERTRNAKRKESRAAS